jgi:hypothetical protein
MARAKKTDADDLYERLAAFHFDDPSAERPFSARLAQENGWTAEFTAQAIDEYRRFIVLAITSGQTVVPSAVVDRVWHLHLIYTRSYWDHLCRGILGRPLHHHPSPGGPSANQECRRNYQATLAIYRGAFGVPPPAIWPEPEEPSEGEQANCCNRGYDCGCSCA